MLARQNSSCKIINLFPAFLIVIQPRNTRIWLRKPRSLALEQEVSTLCLASLHYRDSMCSGAGPDPLPRSCTPSPRTRSMATWCLSSHSTRQEDGLSFLLHNALEAEEASRQKEWVRCISSAIAAAPQYFFARRCLAAKAVHAQADSIYQDTGALFSLLLPSFTSLLSPGPRQVFFSIGGGGRQG